MHPMKVCNERWAHFDTHLFQYFDLPATLVLVNLPACVLPTICKKNIPPSTWVLRKPRFGFSACVKKAQIDLHAAHSRTNLPRRTDWTRNNVWKLLSFGVKNVITFIISSYCRGFRISVNTAMLFPIWLGGEEEAFYSEMRVSELRLAWITVR
jgi:hypothetical protein